MELVLVQSDASTSAWARSNNKCNRKVLCMFVILARVRISVCVSTCLKWKHAAYVNMLHSFVTF